MPHYHLSLTTDQPVAIKTRISTKGISSDAAGSGVNSGGEMDRGDAMVTVDELNTKLQLLEMQLDNLGKHLETIKRLIDQGQKRDSSKNPQGFWRRLGISLRQFLRHQPHRLPERADLGHNPLIQVQQYSRVEREGEIPDGTTSDIRCV